VFSLKRKGEEPLTRNKTLGKPFLKPLKKGSLFFEKRKVCPNLLKFGRRGVNPIWERGFVNQSLKVALWENPNGLPQRGFSALN